MMKCPTSINRTFAYVSSYLGQMRT